jgi:glycosyltransferase involved in cell wall biosynthesis
MPFVSIRLGGGMLVAGESVIPFSCVRGSSGMRIAQIAPLFESVPPQGYGGTERVVSYLTEELVRRGHEVTLFASGDSQTRARFIPCCPSALRLDAACTDAMAYHFAMLEKVQRRADEFDILHYHVDYLHYPFTVRHGRPNVTTLHGRLNIPELVPVYEEFPRMAVVSISDAQRAPLPWINWQGTVYHGLPPDLHTFSPGPGKYLAFLGRMSPEKRVDRAIVIARRAGMPLKIAAKVDRADRAYFDAKVKPLLTEPGVEFLGEIGGAAKDCFLGDARALLFPIDWPEPFGLVMIEALACGTPLIAWRNGSVPEIMTDGVTGYVVEDMDEAVRAVARLDRIDRRRCREVFEERFVVSRMTDNYLDVYRRVRGGWSRPSARNGRGTFAPRLHQGDGTTQHGRTLA